MSSDNEHPPADHEDDGLQWSEVVEAARAAELADGGEETPEQVRAHIAIRLARMSLASVLLIAGVAMLILPGPGWLVLAAGFALLARDVAWAERWVVAVRRRVPGARDDGSLPAGVWITIIVVALAGLSLSLWFVLR